MDKQDKKDKKNKKTKKKDSPVVDKMVNEWETASDDDVADILGSYTGNPYIGDLPEQDADDL
jgi:hypothetical protein